MRSLYDNRAGKTDTVKILGIIAMVVLVIGAFALVTQTSFDTGETPEGVTKAQQDCADASGILYVNDVSKIPGGTAPTSPSITCSDDEGNVAVSVTSGTTTFPVGNEVTCLVSDTDSLDEKFTFTMPCGGKQLSGSLYYSTSDNPKIGIKDSDAQTNDLTDAIGGGAYNASDVTAGTSFDFEVEFESTSGESSGDGIYVIELPAGSNANVSDVTMGSLVEISIPRVHSSVNAGSKIVAFEVPMVTDGKSVEYKVNVELESAKDLSGGIYTDWYAKQWFIDTDYKLVYGIENADGTAKYENTIDYDFFLASA